LTLMLLAQVAVKLTFALLVPVGVTVYLRLPQPVTGRAEFVDCQVPANASIDVVGPLGDVGVDELSFLFKRSHPAASAHATTSAEAKVDFMFFLS